MGNLYHFHIDDKMIQNLNVFSKILRLSSIQTPRFGVNTRSWSIVIHHTLKVTLANVLWIIISTRHP